MDRDRAWLLVVALVLGAVVVTLGVGTGVIPLSIGEDYDRATVTIRNPDGSVAATVEAEVADTSAERYQGLSGTDPLANGTGMLFVHGQEESLTYVMREMNYGLDMIFVGADQRVNVVHSAPPPGPEEDGNDITRSGRGKWVLEVPRGYANATGIDPGDTVEIEYGE